MVIWLIKTCNNGRSYYITDRRLMTFGENYWQEIPLEDVVSTKVSGNKITVRALISQDMHKRGNYVIPDIKDALNVKYRLDKAIEKCKADQNKA